jgi:hypothetical protein
MRKFRIALLLYVAFDLFILGNTAGVLPLTPLLAGQTSVNVPNYPPIRQTPDCLIQGSFTATGTSTIYDNRGNGCTTWHLVYSNTGYSALNIALQSADDAGGTPSAFANWGTSGGTLATGTTLPLTATTSGQATGYKYRPYIQVNLSSATGSGRVWYMAYGYRPGNTDSSGAGGGTTNVQGTSASGTSDAGINPVLIACDASGGSVSNGQISNIKCGTNGSILTLITQTAGDGIGNTFAGAMSAVGGAGLNLEVWPFIFNGTSWDRPIVCPNKAKLNTLGAATTQIVALSGATKIRICTATISNNNATATTLKFVEGTGANCGTGTADVSALMNIGATSTAPVFLNYGSTAPLTITTGGDALCLTSSAASSLEITITYEQH